MGRIVIFGAGGRAGRAAVEEARMRGHQVTAVVRDPARYDDLAADGVAVVAGDVTDADSVAAVADGHDAAISAAYRADAPPAPFFTGAAIALLDGLTRAGVGRLLDIGLVATLETEPGVRIMDDADFPEPWRQFAQGHAKGLEVMRAATADLDWLVVTPPMVLDDAPRTGSYQVGHRLLTNDDGTSHLSYADLAVALLDEIEVPKHHRTQIAVAD